LPALPDVVTLSLNAIYFSTELISKITSSAMSQNMQRIGNLIIIELTTIKKFGQDGKIGNMAFAAKTAQA